MARTSRTRTESISSATGLLGFRGEHRRAKAERSRDIHGSPAEDSLRLGAQTGLPRPKHIAVEIFLLLLLPLLWVACAAYSGQVASSKGHDAVPWALGGFLLGPLALLAAVGLPDLKLRKYLRLLAEHQGALAPEAPPTGMPPRLRGEDADAQRRRIFGVK
jgi:hypothetical protein